ncbi:MAG TPA: ATP-binding protein, partial [Plasticicumulans sp.]|nr:ATP-binding protein [Plasticicumulans sp.]
MAVPLKLLVIEDVETDFLLAVRVLTRHGYAPQATRVDRLDALEAALAEGGWELAISDYNLPGLSFDASFARVCAQPGLPLILLSGSVGEERAVELLKSGVADFVLKSNLGRLPPAVDRCLRERAESRARAEAESALADYRAQLESLVATRTEELRQRERDLQAILDNVPALIGYWDRDLRNRFANQAYHDWLGIPAGGMHGMHKREALGPVRYERVHTAVETALRGEPGLIENEFPHADGSCRYVQTHYLPDLRDGEVHGVYVLVSDVTELKRAEQAAEAARLDAERLARVKADFLANMSHEIRTPLNAVLGFAELGLDQSEGRRVHETLRRIHDAGQLLLGIVDDILDYSKIEAGKLTLEDAPFAPGAVVDRVIDVIAGRARERGLELCIDEAPDLPQQSRGDALRLAQVLLNLMSNAVKFTERGGCVTLSVRHDDDGFTFGVTDTGIGMAAGQLARLFQPFEQADGSITRRFGGTGLGLAICARLTALMGGRIRVDSRCGAGSRFEVCVPLPALPAPPPVLPDGAVAILGLTPAESTALIGALAVHGVTGLQVGADAPLPAAVGALVAARGADQGRALLGRAAGRRLVLVGAPVHDSPALLRGIPCVDRPLRPRQVLAALAS